MHSFSSSAVYFTFFSLLLYLSLRPSAAISFAGISPLHQPTSSSPATTTTTTTVFLARLVHI
jgi:hypothetical protein